MGKKKRYSDDFRREAVARVLGGETPLAVSKSCGASVYSVRDWVKASEQAARERPATKAELDEIRRLKRELRQVKEDNEILKKATALFAEECK